MTKWPVERDQLTPRECVLALLGGLLLLLVFWAIAVVVLG